MSRLQKKCYIAATGAHLLLLLILLIGPALLASHDKDTDIGPVMTVIDLSKLTDGPTQTGGKPSPPPPSSPTPPPPEPERTQPTPPKPSPPEPTPDEPEKTVKPKETAEPSSEKVKIKAQDVDNSRTAEKPAIHVAKKIVTRSTDNAAAKAKAAAQAAAAAKQARAAAVNRVLGDIEDNLSTGTEVSVPGPGAATFVNYAEAVKRVYTAAWNAPSDVTDERATAKASVTIARDGSVVSAQIKTSSGNASVDRSVEQTLRRVRFVAPFPDGAKDDQRTFIINFNLKAKRLLG